MDQVENHNDSIELKEIDNITPEFSFGTEVNNCTDFITNAKSPINKECSVIGCEESKSMEPELLFKFPEDPDIRQVWISLTGRSNWMPTEDSYICVVHFSVDSFTCNDNDEMVLYSTAIPSLRLPSHVLEIEYIEDSDSESDDSSVVPPQMNGDISYINHRKNEGKVELLKLFTKVQRLQREATNLKDRLKYNKRHYVRQKKYLQRLKEIITNKELLLKHKRKKLLNIDIPLLETIQDERDDLILSMPTKYTDDLKNFALSIYKYSPQSYVYIRNTLRTMLPSSNVLEGWIKAGYQPRNVMSNSGLVKVVTEQTESELICKVCLH